MMIETAPLGQPEDNFLATSANFENTSDVDQVVERTLKKFARLDVLVNNAGFPGHKRPFEHEDFYADFKRVLQVNLMAPTRIAQLAAEHLVKTKGVIINVSSIADRLAMPNVSYSVSKAGLSMLTKTLANALGGTGVRVVGVSPGPVRSNFVEGIEALNDMSSLNRVGEPSEVADLIVFLSSQKASYINGSTVDIDGGIYAKLGDSFTQLREDFRGVVKQ